jgi:hypothetical protein
LSLNAKNIDGVISFLQGWSTAYHILLEFRARISLALSRERASEFVTAS